MGCADGTITTPSDKLVAIYILVISLSLLAVTYFSRYQSNFGA